MDTQNTPSPADMTGTESVDHTALLEWNAPRSHSHERGKHWYMGGSIAVLAAAAYAILTGAWSLAIAAVLIGGLYYLLRKEPPVLHSLRVEETGLQYDGQFFHWGDFDEAWFVQTTVGPELHIHRKRGAPREIVLLTPKIDVTIVRSTMSRFLKFGSDRQENMIDLVIRLCKL